MRYAIALIALTGLLFTLPVAQASDDYTAQCKEQAKSDEIPADEMKEYIAECVADLKASAGN
ncbi:MAG: hypothetical protein ACPGU7_06995 [Gammaproteobacteria bacterium]